MPAGSDHQASGRQRPSTLWGRERLRTRAPGHDQMADVTRGEPRNEQRMARTRHSLEQPRGGGGNRGAGRSDSTDEPGRQGSNSPPARNVRSLRHVATLVAHVGDQPPRLYASAAPWRTQLRVQRARGLDVSLPPEAPGRYCEICGGLVIDAARHAASELHISKMEEAAARPLHIPKMAEAAAQGSLP
ncbi:uncharacterized protein LOC125942093 [Dermacentor silvarum]|uniref:uncharacterized protein LOC125942093 n=1 Tax=Dermacentor silvarum TaxID=543639 RepID=UPI0021016BDA|nr:uncharacterized protein LOC125942093 [Dermacentor silvarum]